MSQNQHRPGEVIFAQLAPALVEMGWSVYPQDRTERRRPGQVRGELIEWISTHDLPNQKPTPKALKDWCNHNPSLNVAGVMGAGSGHIWALDIDIMDEELCRQIQEIAIAYLGDTPFKRVGRWPKIAFLYRYPEDAPVRSTSKKFAQIEEDGTIVARGDGIETVSSGKSMTFFGIHHKTGGWFKWLDKSPLDLGPDAAPIVAPDQVDRFLRAVGDVYPYYRSSSSATLGPVNEDWQRVGEVMVPQRPRSLDPHAWVEDETGRVIDGRETYLTNLVNRTVRARPNIGLREDLLVQQIVDTFCERAVADGRWDPSRLPGEVSSRVRRVIAKLESGDLAPLDARERPKEEAAKLAGASLAAGIPKELHDTKGDLRYLPPPVDPDDPRDIGLRQKLPIYEKMSCPEPTGQTGPVRDTGAIEAAQEQLTGAIQNFFELVYGDVDHDGAPGVVHIIKAPPGTGKTTRVLNIIANDPRTYFTRDAVDANGDPVGPIVFLLPTYANIAELKFRADAMTLDPKLPDDEFRRAAEDKGLLGDGDSEAQLARLKDLACNSGLRTMIYRGRLAAGCQMADKMEMIMSAGLRGSSLCKAEVRHKDGEKETVFCKHYHECPAILQKQDIANSDIVFVPHAFMSLDIPEELKNVRAVVADERIHHMFLHTATMQLSTLLAPRRPPKLTQAEDEAGVTPEDILADRDLAARVAISALRGGQCPAQALLDYNHGRFRSGSSAAERALRVCKANLQPDQTINPNISTSDLETICSRPTGVELREEARFWKIVVERIQHLSDDALVRETVTSATTMLETATDPQDRASLERRVRTLEQISPGARGDRDMRLQYLPETDNQKESVRLSWRSVPNWVERPTMLLDASAAPRVIQKIWNNVPTFAVDIDAPKYLRTVSVIDRTNANASFIRSEKSTSPEAEYASADALDRIRRFISTIAHLYAHGRVVVGSSILMRKLVNAGWVVPSNVDWCHFGAMRGLDFAKHHLAAISIGRMELPLQTMDGLVAALTYDDEEPELPVDLLGTGRHPSGDPLMLPKAVQDIHLRTGHILHTDVPRHPTPWGRLIQKQYREEELLQFEGRLRPIHRDGEPPVWFNLCSVIPEEVIADDVLMINDVIDQPWTPLMEAARRCEGILEPRLLTTQCAFICSDETVARAELAAAGFDGGLSSGDRLSQGFAAFHTVLFDGTTTTAYVASYVAQPEALLEDRIAEAYDVPVERITRLREVERDMRAQARPMDALETSMPSRHERTVLQTDFERRAAIEALKHGYRYRQEGDAPVSCGFGIPALKRDLHSSTQRDRRRPLTHTGFEALLSIRAYRSAIKDGGFVSMDPNADNTGIEHLADHVYDADTIDSFIRGRGKLVS